MKRTITLVICIIVMLVTALTTEAKPPRHKKRGCRAFTCHTYDHSYPPQSWRWMRPRGKCTNRRF